MESLVDFYRSLLVQWPETDSAADAALEEALETYERVLRRCGREDRAVMIRDEIDSRRARRVRRLRELDPDVSRDQPVPEPGEHRRIEPRIGQRQPQGSVILVVCPV